MKPLLFSVDYPFENTEETAQFIESAPASDAEKEQICSLNARRLLGI
jgi:2,3-dihydroxybenzoate decarboxylase